jgi:hypothetical protein
MSERRTWRQQQYRLERFGFQLEVTPAGKRYWHEPGTERRLSGEYAIDLVRREEERALREAGWEPVEIEGETYWRRPDSGRLYPREPAYDVIKRSEEE